MTRYTLFFIILFVASTVTGQSRFEDWKARGQVALLEEDYSNAITYLEYAKRIIPKKMSLKTEGEVYNDLGVAYYQVGEYKKGIEACSKALELYKYTDIDTLIAGSMYNLGISYKDLGLSNLSMDYLLQSARIFERNQCWLKLSASWNSIGNVCRDTKEFSKAINYHKRALTIRKRIGYDKGIADSYQNLGSVYLEWEKYSQSEFFLKKALHKKQILHQANIVTTYSSLGRLYVSKGELQIAKSYLTKAYELRMMGGNSVKVAESLFYLANYYTSVDESEKGLELFHEIERIARLENQPQLLSDALREEIILLPKNGNEKLLIAKYKELLKFIKQSDIEENKKETDRLEITYDVERKNRELALRRKQSRIDQLRFRQLLIVSACILLLAIIAWIGFYYIRRNKRKIERQKEEIKYLHYELSHRTKNYFSLVSGMLVLDKKKARGQETIQALDQVKRRLEAMSLVQHYLLDDSSLNNKEVELSAYFTSLTNTLLIELFTFKSQPNMIQNFEEVYLDYDKAMRLAIVLNELVCNAVEHGLPHSTNPELSISVQQKGHQLQLVVKDNGPGIQLSGAEKQDKKGVGLIEKLLQNLDGILTYRNDGGCIATVLIKL